MATFQILAKSLGHIVQSCLYIFPADQIYDLSYIHLHSSPSMGILQYVLTHYQIPKLQIKNHRAVYFLLLS